jgi:hypothetical protein
MNLLAVVSIVQKKPLTYLSGAFLYPLDTQISVTIYISNKTAKINTWKPSLIV